MNLILSLVMNLNKLLELIEKGNLIKISRKKDLIKILSSSTPHNNIDRKYAPEALSLYEIIDSSHQMSKMDSLIGMKELLKNLKLLSLTNNDYVDEVLYFSANKKITTIVLNEKEVVGVTEAWKSDWHKNNS